LENPSIKTVDEGLIFSLSVAKNSALILARMRSNYEYLGWKDGTSGIAILRETTHQTAGCGCQATFANNNFEGPFYALFCIPEEHVREFRNQYSRWDTNREASGAPLQLVNASMTFVSTVSKYNTCLPRLMQRQPLSRIARESPMLYKAPGSLIDFRRRRDVLRCLLTHMNRPEFMHTLARFEDPHGFTTDDEWCRFPPLEEQRKSTDVQLRKD